MASASLAMRDQPIDKLTARQKKAMLTPVALQELNQIEELVGGRADLIAALVTAPQTEGVTYLVGLLADPDRAGLSLADVCAQARLLPTDILEALIAGRRARARVQATHLATEDVPRIVKDIVLRAAPFTDKCYRCLGQGRYVIPPTDEQKKAGEVGAFTPCEICHTTGQLLYPADDDCRKTALELAGLLAKGGASVNVSIQQNRNTLNLNTQGLAGDGVTLQEAMDEILYGGGPAARDADDQAPALDVVDAELVPEAAPQPPPAPDPAVVVVSAAPASAASPASSPGVMPPPGRRP